MRDGSEIYCRGCSISPAEWRPDNTACRQQYAMHYCIAGMYILSMKLQSTQYWAPEAVLTWRALRMSSYWTSWFSSRSWRLFRTSSRLASFSTISADSAPSCIT